MTEHWQEEADARLRQLKTLCSIDGVLMSLENRDFTDGSPRFCVDRCPHAKGIGTVCARNTHLYGCFESQRWMGKYIYYCPFGLVFMAATWYSEQGVAEGFWVLGPFMMGALEDWLDITGESGWAGKELAAEIPQFSAGMAHALLEVSAALCHPPHAMNELQRGTPETLLDPDFSVEKSALPDHWGEEEALLRKLILSQDSVGARAQINKILGHVYFFLGDLETVKARAAQLIVMLSKAALDGGADADRILWLNNGYFREMERFETLDELCRGLSDIIHRYISYMFDFPNVKHMDTIFKITSYIQENIAGKVSLEDVAAHVYLSRSSLSRIFKDEMGLPFTAFCNDIRVARARQLLQTELSLAEIAQQCGFEDQSYFAKVFKKQTGMPPGQYRNKK